MSTIVTRAGKGSPLTNTEMDSNLTNLNTDKYQSGDSPTFTLINNLTVGRGNGNVATNTAVGASALAANTSGSGNVAVGDRALAANTTATNSVAVGQLALYANTTGTTNNALGHAALFSNTTGSNNVAAGDGALFSNTTASSNIAVGYQAGYSNTTGAAINAFGRQSLYSNTTANYNSAFGDQTLYSNTTGASNVAMGTIALYSNTTGSNNVGIGQQALQANTTGSATVAIGYQAGYSSNSNNSVFVGNTAGYTGAAYSVFIGNSAGYNTSGLSNTFIGTNYAYGTAAGKAVTTGAKNTIIGGYDGNMNGLDIRTASNYIVLSDGDGNPRGYFDNAGSIFVPRTYLDTTASAANMFITSAGQYARSTSALKYKQDIRDVEDFDIGLLRPVRYKSKCEGDDQTKDHLGLIADEAAEAGFEELVIRDAEGEIEGFQYERLTVVLLKKLQVFESEFKAYKEAHP